ncbi:unnamed protein product [Auanema sp. JU1783]|nr:unnamed protein product [Auanema sp. JU1783]
MMTADDLRTITFPGMIPIFPDIMQEVNASAENISDVIDRAVCMCSDLQTEDYSPLYAWYNYLLIIIALPSLSVFGVFTNIINVFLFTRKRLRTSANTYLLFLACSDFLVIVTGLFIFWIDSARSYIPELARAPYTTVYTLPFGYMAQSCSIYFTVAAAFDCYINVCWKSLSKNYCTVRQAKKICFTVIVISIMYNSLRFPQFNLRKCFHEASQEHIIEICPTSLFFTINVIYNIYMYMVLMTLLPFLFLLCLNAIILCRQSLERKKSKDSNSTQASSIRVKADDAAGDDTITMIMVVILFLACNTLALVVNMIETFSIPDPLVVNLLSDASNFLVIFNSSVNCVIYMIFNKDYRECFQHHGAHLLRLIRQEYCCCFIRQRDRQGAYQAVTTTVITENGKTAVDMENDRISPVWQPLSQRQLPNLNWSSGCFDPTNTISLADDDGDSGWGDDATSTNDITRPSRQRWQAEVNLLDANQKNSSRLQTIMKPVGQLNKQDLSITAL